MGWALYAAGTVFMAAATAAGGGPVAFLVTLGVSLLFASFIISTSRKG